MRTHALFPDAVTAVLLLLGAGAHAQWRAPSGFLSLGDQCRLDDGRRGVCKEFQYCPDAIKEVHQGRQPTVCFFDRFAAVPCCPVETKTSSSSITAAPITTPETQRPITKPSSARPVSRPNTPRPVTTPNTPKPKPAPAQPPGQCIEPAEGFSPSSKEERSLIQLAEQKCIEYRKYVYVLERIPTLLVTDEDQYNNRSTCAMDREPLIVGGVPASPREFPHMAVIGYGARKDNNWLCGGSLISSRHILTAGHCLRSGAGCAQRVLLGALVLNETSLNTEPQEFNIVRRFRHPEYNPPERYNDIAILELDRDVDFTGYIRPACLYMDYAAPNGDKGIAVGFGRQHWLETEGSNTLMKVTLPFQSYSECNKTYRTSFRLPNGIEDRSMLCAGDLAGNKDTCQGDSGGPLQVRDIDNCMYKIIGLTSFGSPKCGDVNSPAIYTRISTFVPWVAKMIWT